MPVDVIVLDEAQRARLAGERFGRVLELAQATSTNTVLAAQAGAGAPEGLVVVADYQTAGRGRFDRRWEAKRGKSLLFSVLARPKASELSADRRYLAVAAVSLALREAALAVAGAELALKWPNDLVEAAPPQRKVAGLLAEAAGDALVVGAGLNIAWAPPGAICLEEMAGRHVERGEVLVETLLALARLYGRWEDVLGLYRRHCSTLGRQVTVSLSGGAPDLHGRAVDVDENGRLLVLTRAGRLEPAVTLAIAAGDVTHAHVGAASSVP